MRTELPWHEIQKDVKRAIDDEMPGNVYINVNRLVQQIQENDPERYPMLGGLLVKTMKYRCTWVMRHVWGWDTYTKGNGRGTVFVRGDEK